MSTKEIKPGEWKKFFDAYTKKNKGQKIKLEVMNEEMGVQVLTENLPLGGITAETENGNNHIEIMLGENRTEHISHTITNPLKVMLNAPFKGMDTLEFEAKDGTKTILSSGGAVATPQPGLLRRRTSDRSLRRNSLL